MLVLNNQQTHLKTVRTTLAIIVAPAQYIINWPAKMLEWVEESFSGTQKLLLQNEDLQGQVLLLKARLQKLLLLEQENTQLRALLQSSPRSTEKVLVAQLLAVDPDPFAQQVILNKGDKEGAYLGQPVIDGNGVFGQIIQVGTFNSRVLLITDARSAIPVQDSRSGMRGIIVGKGNSTRLALINMPITADIKVGDYLVTSGLGERFPVGYPVGIITSIEKNPGSEFSNVTVMPNAHINRSHLVLLVWPQVVKALQAEKKILRLAAKKLWINLPASRRR
jgi:rod shape-determining protein MreC